MLDLLHETVALPLSTANATASSIFRVIELASPTLLIDEADTFLKDNDELRGVLNSGHRYNGHVLRTVGDDTSPADLPPSRLWRSPRLATFLIRCKTVPFPCGSHVENPTKLLRYSGLTGSNTCTNLASKAARWASDNEHALRASDPATGTLFNRVADNWRPLLAIADLVGGNWPRRAREVAETAAAEREDFEQSIRVLLLSEIRKLFDDLDEKRLPSSILVEHLNRLEGRPWADWRNGKGMTTNQLARQLRHFGISPGQLKFAGDHNLRGYERHQFEDAFSRYLNDTNATVLQQQENQAVSTKSKMLPIVGDSGLETAEKARNSVLGSTVAVEVDNCWPADDEDSIEL